LGKKSSKTTTKNEPPKWAVPHLKGAMGTITNTVNANQGNLDAAAGQIRGFLPGLGAKAFGQDPGLGAATNYATDVLGGKYLNNNPYIDQMASLARGNAFDMVNSNFSKSGRVGSTLHAEDIGRGVSEAELGVRYQNYGNERNAMTQAAGLMPALNQSQYAGIMPYLAAQQTAAGLPFTGIQNLGMLGGLTGVAGGTQTSQQPGGWGSQVLGAAASALPFILCERDAKTKVKLIRREGDGLGWYEFAYKREPGTMLQGPMADEVERLRPWALGPRLPNGWRTINLAKISEAA
jgi:hypothetical protein